MSLAIIIVQFVMMLDRIINIVLFAKILTKCMMAQMDHPETADAFLDLVYLISLVMMARWRGNA